MALEEIHLHIGIPKTGTTSVQVDVIENRDHYEDYGISYFPAFLNGYDHHALARALHGGDRAAVSRAFAENLKPESATDVLISSEMLYHLGVVTDLIECMPARCLPLVHVIMYVRRQDQYLESLAKQYKKMGMLEGSMAGYIEANRQAGAYASFIEKLHKVAPSVIVTCRPFEPALLVGGDIVADFRSILNVPLPKVPMASSHWARNKAPSRELAEAAGGFDFASFEERIKVLDRVMRKAPELAGSDDILSMTERQALMASFREENRRLSEYCGVDFDALFFRDVDLDLAGRTEEESLRLGDHALAWLRHEREACRREEQAEE
jgi:hypothetical protein